MCLINITIEPTKFAAIFSNYIRISFIMCLVQSSCWDDRCFLFLESHNCRRVVTIYYSKWSFKENLFCLISSTKKFYGEFFFRTLEPLEKTNCNKFNNENCTIKIILLNHDRVEFLEHNILSTHLGFSPTGSTPLPFPILKIISLLCGSHLRRLLSY